jgi:hypothetical protein
MNISVCWNLWERAFSPENNATTAVASRRTLQGVRVDPFAALLDRSRYQFKICQVDSSREAEKIAPWRSFGCRQPAREVQDQLLLSVIQSVDLTQ